LLGLDLNIEKDKLQKVFVEVLVANKTHPELNFVLFHFWMKAF
jgi:hypothetical protein